MSTPKRGWKKFVREYTSTGLLIATGLTFGLFLYFSDRAHQAHDLYTRLEKWTGSYAAEKSSLSPAYQRIHEAVIENRGKLSALKVLAASNDRLDNARYDAEVGCVEAAGAGLAEVDSILAANHLGPPKIPAFESILRETREYGAAAGQLGPPKFPKHGQYGPTRLNKTRQYSKVLGCNR